MESGSLPLNVCRVKRTDLVMNRVHIFIHGFALAYLLYFRSASIFSLFTLPNLFIFTSEVTLSVLWLVHQAFRWRPVVRTVYPERLPKDASLPPIDVFICTADPFKEPSLGVMNSVISAMALDYPPDRLAVYLSDDSGSPLTLQATREAWEFARWWIPFCRRYEVSNRCPEAYFSTEEKDSVYAGSSEFAAEEMIIKKRYIAFKNNLVSISVTAGSTNSKDHPSTVEVMNDAKVDSVDSPPDMPLLVYVAREKRPSHPHHFKGGAINTLLRVSALNTNAPYFLILDCDMYCNDPSSALQAMCFYLDSKVSSRLGFVQFPQKFGNISVHDIYDARLNYYWRRWLGSDGIRGPFISGCNFYMRREAIYGTDNIRKDLDLNQLKAAFGSSHELIKSVNNIGKKNMLKDEKSRSVLQKEILSVASCSYDNHTKWGKEVGFRYSVVEDSVTSVVVHSQGWISVFIDPARPCFLGSATTNLNDFLVQQTRWSLGLFLIALSKYSPLFYGLLRMPILQSLCYAANTLDSLYTIPICILSVVPQICLLHGVPLYPSVSNPMFVVFAFLFLSSHIKHVQDLYSGGDSLWAAVYELRIWMMKSVSCYLLATCNATLEKLGLYEVNFSLTNKAVDGEQDGHYQKGMYDFQASPVLIVPMCSLYILNVVSFIIGVPKMFLAQNGNQMLIQAFISLYGILVNYHLFQGMVLRKDNGAVLPSVLLVSCAISAVIVCFGSLFFLH